MCGGAAHDHHGHFARVEVELLAFTHGSAEDALSEVTNIYPSLKLRVAEMAKKGMKKLKVVEKKRSKPFGH